MAPTLYVTVTSPPARACLITSRGIGLDLTKKELDFSKRAHLTPEFLKINPQHTVPTLVDDDGFTLWDSHAVMAYLVSKYAKSDALYPKDLKKRALINQRLHFDSGVLYPKLGAVFRPVNTQGKKSIDQADKDTFNEVYGFLEAFLDGKKWMAGDSVTIADYSLIATLSSVIPLIHIDAAKFPKLATWVKECEALPEYQVNIEGAKRLSEVVKRKLEENQNLK